LGYHEAWTTMSPYRKNLMVGVVVLGGLVVLGWMILQFGDAPIRLFSTEQIRVQFVADRAEGITAGSAITFRGVGVGKVESVQRGDDHQHVIIGATIDREPPLPGNVIAAIRSSGLIGSGATIALQVAGDQPEGQLQPDQVIETAFVGLDLLPPEFAELATELKLSARAFRESNIVADLDETVKKAGQMIDSLNRLVDDPQSQSNLKQSLANIAEATETATRIAANLEKFTANLQAVGDETTVTIRKAQGAITKVEGHVDNLSGQLTERLAQVAGVLDTIQSITRKIDQGKGTAGALVNDPRLYESLLLTSEQLNAMITDLKRLVEQWEQEGAAVRLR
jgi:phospholipid/cholesterol/gamma-HCH transport system substrate-binding protein